MRGADVASDHHLVMGTVKIKLRSFKDTSDRPHVKFNTQQLRNQETKQAFSISLKNKFAALDSITEETPIDSETKKQIDIGDAAVVDRSDYSEHLGY